MAAFREDQVQNSLGFLTHPSVVQRAKHEKETFLRGKGLTEAEITEAFRRADAQLGVAPGVASASASSPQPPQQQQQPQVVYYQAPPSPPPEQPWWAKILVPSTMMLSAGAALAFLYKTLNNQTTDRFPWEMQPPPMPLPLQQQQQQQPHLPGAPPQMLPHQGHDALLPPPMGNNTNTSTAIVPSSQMSLQQQQQQQPPFSSSPSYLINAPPSSSNSTPATPNELMIRHAIEDQATTLREVVTSLKEVTSQLQQLKSNNGGDSTNMVQAIMAMHNSSELKAELSAIKALLMAGYATRSGNHDASSSSSPQGLLTAMEEMSRISAANHLSANVTNNTSTLEQQQQNQEDTLNKQQQQQEATEQAAAAKKEQDARIQKSRETLATMVLGLGDDTDAIFQACNLLILFLKNIVKEPNNTRYRRIARSNANFKKCLEHVEHHKEFIEAMGFEEKGSLTFELGKDWVESLENEGWAKLVMQDAIANLEMTKGTGNQQQQQPDTPPGMVNTERESTPISNIKALSKSTLPGPTPATPLDRWSSPTSYASALATPPPPQPQPPPATTTEAGETAPLSFAEVVRMHKEGIPFPGVKEIPNVLSSDPPSKPSGIAPPKPWETQQRPASSAESEVAPLSFAEMMNGRSSNNGSRVEITHLPDGDHHDG